MEEGDLMYKGGQVLHVPVGVEEGGEQTGAQVVQVAARSRGGAAPPAGPRKGDRRAPREKVFSPRLPSRAERASVVGVGGLSTGTGTAASVWSLPLALALDLLLIKFLCLVSSFFLSQL